MTLGNFTGVILYASIDIINLAAIAMFLEWIGAHYCFN